MKSILLVLISLLLLFFSSGTVIAQNPNGNANSNAAVIPEKNGDYPDPEHPGVRVRVFVHEPKERLGTSVSAVCEDPPSNAVVGKTGWKLPSGNWNYKINTSSVPSSVGGSNLSSMTANGFSVWISSITSSSKPLLNESGITTKTKSSYDRENIIAWGRTSGNALGVTYTRYYTSTGLVVDVDTIMNKKFPWTLNTCSTNAYDAADILTHELGHWFGLNDHYSSAYINNTMYGYGSKAETKKITPEQGDKDGINLIYP